MEAAKIQKGSKESNRSKSGKVTWAQVEAIAKEKMPDPSIALRLKAP